MNKTSLQHLTTLCRIDAAMRKANKYNYYKVIQGNYGQGWNDEDFHECDNTGFIRTKEARDALKTNLKAYRENGDGSYHVITRKELAI